jgi:hypothetical protein
MRLERGTSENPASRAEEETKEYGHYFRKSMTGTYQLAIAVSGV